MTDYGIRIVTAAALLLAALATVAVGVYGGRLSLIHI